MKKTWIFQKSLLGPPAAPLQPRQAPTHTTTAPLQEQLCQTLQQSQLTQLLPAAAAAEPTTEQREAPAAAL